MIHLALFFMWDGSFSSSLALTALATFHDKRQDLGKLLKSRSRCFRPCTHCYRVNMYLVVIAHP